MAPTADPSFQIFHFPQLTMNSSDNPGPGNDGIQPWIDPDLEARIVAAVVGEASDFEMAELDRMLEAKPELAVFKRRIEAVHGLVGESYAQPQRWCMMMISGVSPPSAGSACWQPWA